MSYILDALRRADAERERGAVPGLNAQRFAPEDPADDEPRRRPGGRRWLAAGAAAGLLLIGAALAWQLTDEPAPSRSVTGTVPAVPTASPGPVAAVEPAPAVDPRSRVRAPLPAAQSDASGPTVPAATAPPAAAPAARPVPPAAPVAAKPSREPAVPADRSSLAKPPVPSDVTVAPPQASRPSAAAAPAGAHTAAAAASGPATRGQPAARPVVERSRLPEEIRRQLPQLAIGGSIYSQDRANRFLIINGQVFYEGSQPSPGLVLEEIGLRSAVLRFKEYRYSIAY